MRPPILPVEDLEASIVRLTKAETDAPPLTFPEVSVNYVPGRALLFSAIFHQLVVLLILLLSFTLSRTYLPGSRAFNGTIKLSDASGVIYLPVLGGGDEGNGHEGGSPGAASKASSPAPSRSSKGRAYPGPQPILSDPENPTNQQQTIIQPAAEKLEAIGAVCTSAQHGEDSQAEASIAGRPIGSQTRVTGISSRGPARADSAAGRESQAGIACGASFGTDPARGREDPSSGSRQSGRAT